MEGVAPLLNYEVSLDKTKLIYFFDQCKKQNKTKLHLIYFHDQAFTVTVFKRFFFFIDL